MLFLVDGDMELGRIDLIACLYPKFHPGAMLNRERIIPETLDMRAKKDGASK